MKISFQSAQKQFFITKKRRKGNDVKMSEMLFTAFSLSQITQNKGQRNYYVMRMAD
jgi:hypothetical protein